MWKRWLLAIVAILCCASAAHSQTRTLVRQPWYETAIDTDAITIEWATNEPVSTTLSYGLTTAYERGTVSGGTGTAHGVTLTHLASGTTYAVRIIVQGTSGNDTIQFYTSTASPSVSSGTVEVYFNREIDTTLYPLSGHAHAGAELLGALKPLIDSARHSVDLALYSFSGRTGNTVRSWLRDARARGVRVRLIADSASIKNSSAYRGLAADSIPAITNGFGATGSSWSNIHHNKFIIVDAADLARAATLTGSWNLSDQQTTTDYQDVVVVRDVALARAYTREFEEEWGSDAAQPDSANSRFSYRKLDNTPRSFRLGSGVEAHLFFSPNGGVTDAIEHLIGLSRSSVLFAMYQFTKSSLAEQLIGAALRGVAVHGIIGAGGASDEFDALTAAGIDVVHYTRYQTLDTLFHHKFSIFDAGQPTAAVATGSFNWTQSAEERNNENELIFMSPELSRDYFFEWLTRYRENGGAQEIGLPAGVASRGAVGPVAVFPNPARDMLAVRWNMERGGAAEIALADELGVTRFHQSGLWSHGVCEAVLQPRVAPGIYVLTVVHDGVTDARRVVILR